jgi:hypothetical protein
LIIANRCLPFLSFKTSSKPKQTLDRDVINYFQSIGTIFESFEQEKLGSVQKHYLFTLISAFGS